MQFFIVVCSSCDLFLTLWDDVSKNRRIEMIMLQVQLFKFPPTELLQLLIETVDTFVVYISGILLWVDNWV